MHQRRRRALQDLLTAVRLKTTVAHAGRALHPNGERVLRPLDRIESLYPRPLVDATRDIAGRCRFSLDELSLRVPGGDRAGGHDAGGAPAPPGRGGRGAALARGNAGGGARSSSSASSR